MLTQPAHISDGKSSSQNGSCTMALAGRLSELQALVFDPKYLQLCSHKGLAGVRKLVTLAFIFKVKLAKILVLIIFKFNHLEFYLPLELFIDHLNVSYNFRKFVTLTLIFKVKLAFTNLENFYFNC